MNITEVIPHPLSVPLKQPSWTAHEISTAATLILVEVRTDDGLVGYGEVQGGLRRTSPIGSFNSAISFEA